MEKKLLDHIDLILNEAKIDSNAFNDQAGIIIDDQSFLIIALESFLDMNYTDLVHKLGAFIGNHELIIPLESAQPNYDWFDVDVLLGNGDSITKLHFIKWLKNEL